MYRNNNPAGNKIISSLGGVKQRRILLKEWFRNTLFPGFFEYPIKLVRGFFVNSRRIFVFLRGFFADPRRNTKKPHKITKNRDE
jgi:hypothetical protein